MSSRAQNKISCLKGAGFLLCIAVVIFPRPAEAASVEESLRQGNRLYRQGQFADSLKLYEDALKKDPESDIVNFNAGTALYKQKQYDEAAAHFQKAILSDDDSLRERAYYNLGNSFYRSGIGREKSDTASAIASLRESLKHFASALALDKKDQDAQYNYDFVTKELERLREEQQKRPQQSQENQNGQKKQGQQQDQQPGSGQADSREGQKQQSGAPQSDPSPAQERPVHSGSVPGAEELTRSEAERLLQNYQQTEEPQGLLRVFKEKHETGAVIKDW